MDVRCEQCGTEYELDEARLKPGGVTVKCTGCGHMFKIRKRSNTGVGPAPAPTGSRVTGDVAAAASGAMAAASGRMSASPSVPPPSAAAGAERNWIIRLENGETRTCRDLSALQAWINAGDCTVETLISRTGKTWKRLGDIPELRPFFDAADASRVTRPRPVSVPPRGGDGPLSTQLGLGIGGVAPLAPPARPLRPPTQPPPPPGDPMRAHAGSGPRPLPLPVPVPASVSMPAMPGLQPGAAAAPGPSVLGAIPGSGAKPTGGVATGAWANDTVRPIESAGAAAAGPSGPMSGSLRSGNTAEPAFSGRIRVPTGELGRFGAGGADDGARRAGDEDFDDDLQPARAPSRTGLWIALAALVVIGGAAAATYFLVLRGKPAKRPAAIATGSGSAALGSGSGSAVVAPPPGDGTAGGSSAPPVPATSPEIIQARAALVAEVPADAKQAAVALAPLTTGEALALRARLLTAQAQALLDEAALTTDAAARDKLRKAATALVLDAVGPAQRAIKAADRDVDANLAMAEVLRLQDKPASDVTPYLEAAAMVAAAPAQQRDVALAQAALAQRGGDLAGAASKLAVIDPGIGSGAPLVADATGAGPIDARARLRAALVRIAQGDKAGATRLVAAVLAVAPTHPLALAAQRKLDTMVDGSDPMPPEDVAAGSAAGSGSSLGDNYDRVLTKANQLAEVSCGQAMPYYQRALALKPTSVEALTGAGFCHLDDGQFASAYSKFNAALAISPRYERALWGMAEGYQQQGNSSRAIEAYQHYLELYPGSAAAKKQLQRLGVETTGSGGGGGGSTTGEGSGGAATGGGGDGAKDPPKDPPQDPPKDPPPGDGDGDGPATMP